LGDWNSIKAAKGIGPKTAQRVVNELKDKAPTVMAMGGSITAAMGEEVAEVVETPAASAPKAKSAPAPKPSMAAQAEALSALSNLGYAPGEAAGAVAQALQDDPEADTSALIRAALRLLAPKG
jgi:Holliday junction DNA helicase RuvA